MPLDPEKARERSRRWRAKHKNDEAYRAKVREYNRAQRAKHASDEDYKIKNRARVKAHRAANAEHYRIKGRDRMRRLRATVPNFNCVLRYGLAPGAVQAMWDRQAGLCAVCGEGMHPYGGRGKSAAVVDHCHATGFVRGLLHQSCNVALGFIEKDLVRTRKLLRYAGITFPEIP